MSSHSEYDMYTVSNAEFFSQISLLNLSVPSINLEYSSYLKNCGVTGIVVWWYKSMFKHFQKCYGRKPLSNFCVPTTLGLKIYVIRFML